MRRNRSGYVEALLDIRHPNVDVQVPGQKLFSLKFRSEAKSRIGWIRNCVDEPGLLQVPHWISIAGYFLIRFHDFLNLEKQYSQIKLRVG